MTAESLYKFTIISLINFLLAAGIGLILRYAYLGETPFNYNHLLHAHSHVAALGWAYQILCTLLTFFFVQKNTIFYKRLFWITQISVVGMLLSFPVQGYGSVSIPFSALHIVCSYFFVAFIWRNAVYEAPLEKWILRSALIFLVLSTLGIWMLGPVIALYGKNSILYQLTIQFYLHFQFSGWFIFALLAILVRYTKKQIRLGLSIKTKKWLTAGFIATVPLGFSLVLFWFFSINGWYMINLITVLLQFLILVRILMQAKGIFDFFRAHSTLIQWLFLTGFFCLLIKILFQTSTFIPSVAQLAHQVRNFSVGYIHLIMLGFLTTITLALLYQFLSVKINWKDQVGILFLFIGFSATEILLFLQGILFISGFGQLHYYHELLLFTSVFLAVSLLFISSSFFTHWRKSGDEPKK